MINEIFCIYVDPVSGSFKRQNGQTDIHRSMDFAFLDLKWEDEHIVNY